MWIMLAVAGHAGTCVCVCVCVYACVAGCVRVHFSFKKQQPHRHTHQHRTQHTFTWQAVRGDLMLVCGGWLGSRLATSGREVVWKTSAREVGWHVSTFGNYERRIFFLPLVLFFAPHRHKTPRVSPRADPGPSRRLPPPPQGNCFFTPCVYTQNTRNFQEI